MVYGDLQFFDILVFAGIAAFLIYRLRGVLGKRGGYEKTIGSDVSDAKNKQENKIIPTLNDNEKKLESIYQQTDGFDHKAFLEGAKKAFEIIISSFNKGDKKTLKNLVSKNVYNTFEKAINENKNNPQSQFYSLVIDSVEDAIVEKEIIKISVNFRSEQIINNDEAAIVKNKDTWTFEKETRSSNPMWLLTST